MGNRTKTKPVNQEYVMTGKNPFITKIDKKNILQVLSELKKKTFQYTITYTHIDTQIHIAPP